MAAEEQGALTEAVYYILLALHEPKHGYAIMQDVQELTKDRLILGPGTLYGALSTLADKGWIKACTEDQSSRRKEYLITDLGRSVFRTELERLEELLTHGKLIVGSENS